MLSNKRFTTVILTLLIVVMFFITLAPIHPVQADSVIGETIFYFVDVFDESLPRDSIYGALPLISRDNPTKGNDSHYPPKLTNFDQFGMWSTYWAIYLLENTEEFGELPDEFEGLKVLLPNPLSIVEVYEYTGNETININGDVTFNIFTSSSSKLVINDNDQVKVSLFSYSDSIPLPIEIANSSLNVSSGILKTVASQTISLKVSDYKLRKDTSLLFSVELIPGDKRYSQILLNNDSWLRTNGLKLIQNLDNISNIPLLDQVISVLELIQNISSELNISMEQQEDVLNSVISTSLVYASQAHPASVSVPFVAGDSNKEDYITYYLHTGTSMDTDAPSSSEHSTLSILDETGIWRGPVLTRNKILSSVSAFVHIEYTDYRLFNDLLIVEAKLLSNGKELASTSQTLSKTTKFTPSINAYRFTFKNLSYNAELFYGTKLELHIGIVGTTNKSSLLPYGATIYYDSQQYRSSLSLKLTDTDHISVEGVSDPIDGKILPGGRVSYTLEVTGELSDTITPSLHSDTFSSEEQKQWKVEVAPSSFSIEDNGKKTVTVAITSLNNTLGAYDADPLRVTLDIFGSTGFTSFPLFAEVSKDAVTFDFIILAPQGKNIVKGSNTSYQFKVINNNTGFYPDGYIFAGIQGSFNLSVFPETIQDIAYQETVIVNVTIDVDQNTEIKTDMFTFKVISKKGGLEKTVKINSTIVGLGVFENIYDYLSSISDQLGLTDVFGSYAPYFIIALLCIILFFIILLLVIILMTKFVDIICLDRIKEIYPNEQAIYQLTIRNPTRKTRSYSVNVELSENGSKWQTYVDKTILLVPSKQSQSVIVKVIPGDAIDDDDWTKATVYVTCEGRKKRSKVDLLTSVKDGTLDLSIDSVFHWPRSFESNQKVQTSFKLHNKGYIQAKKVNISLYINGKEKNKVEDVDIPAGGYADITLPWITSKGKNELQIIVS